VEDWVDKDQAVRHVADQVGGVYEHNNVHREHHLNHHIGIVDDFAIDPLMWGGRVQRTKVFVHLHDDFAPSANLARYEGGQDHPEHPQYEHVGEHPEEEDEEKEDNKMVSHRVGSCL
tara:strand:+ start:3086 stop:3436 length:351 start_codon:yes stop_codon:yes gene_type:complete